MNHSNVYRISKAFTLALNLNKNHKIAFNYRVYYGFTFDTI